MNTKKLYILGISLCVAIILLFSAIVFFSKGDSLNSVANWPPELIPIAYLDELPDNNAFKSAIEAGNKIALFDTSHCKCNKQYIHNSTKNQITLKLDGHMMSSSFRNGQVDIVIDFYPGGWAAYRQYDGSSRLAIYRDPETKPEDFNSLLNKERGFWQMAVHDCRPIFDLEDLSRSLILSDLDYGSQERIVEVFRRGMEIEMSKYSNRHLEQAWESVSLQLGLNADGMFLWAQPIEDEFFDYGMRIGSCWFSIRNGEVEADYDNIDSFLSKIEEAMTIHETAGRGALQHFFIKKNTNYGESPLYSLLDSPCSISGAGLLGDPRVKQSLESPVLFMLRGPA